MLYSLRTSMAFMIRLILPAQLAAQEQATQPVRDRTADFIDADPAQPFFLVQVDDVFAANEVRFEIRGFFEELLPVSTETELVIFLEQLPGLLRFLEDPLLAACSIRLFEQGV